MDGDAPNLIPVEGGVWRGNLRTTPTSLGWTAGDASLIYVATNPDGAGLAGHVVDADGNNDVELMSRFGLYVAVSPDGTRLAYISAPSPTAPHFAQTMDTDGSDVLESPVPHGFFLYRSNFQWSPDGQRLLFGTASGIISVAVTPGSPAVVYSTELYVEFPHSGVTWQPVIP
jgi:hypothetical protein